MTGFFWRSWSRRKKAAVIALCALAIAIPDVLWLVVLN
jgi:hypothetical protein